MRIRRLARLTTVRRSTLCFFAFTNICWKIVIDVLRGEEGWSRAMRLVYGSGCQLRAPAPSRLHTPVAARRSAGPLGVSQHLQHKYPCGIYAPAGFLNIALCVVCSQPGTNPGASGRSRRCRRRIVELYKQLKSAIAACNSHGARRTGRGTISSPQHPENSQHPINF